MRHDQLAVSAAAALPAASSTTSQALTTKPATPLPILHKSGLPAVFDPRVDHLAGRLVDGYSNGNGAQRGLALALRRDPTPEEKTTLETRIADLRGALLPAPPAGDNELRTAIMAMLGGDPNMQRYDQATAYAMASGFLYVVRDQPHWAILEACEQVRSGRAGLNPSFCVKEPEFAIVVRRCTQPYRQRLAEIESLLRARVRQPPPAPPTRAQVEASLGQSLIRRGLMRTIEERGSAIAGDIRRLEQAARAAVP